MSMNTTYKQHLDAYSMFIISGYFETADDFANMTKTCSEYYDIIEKYKYNIIPVILPIQGIKYYQHKYQTF